MNAACRTTIQGRVDGLCLLCLGGFMAALARSGLYWYFLNPKFSPLTLAAGLGIALCGLANLARPALGPSTALRLVRQAVLLGFLSLAALAWENAASQPLPGMLNPAAGDNAAAMPEPQPQAGPRVVKNGHEYLRLNLAELYIMLDKGRKDVPERFALRAPVARRQLPKGPAATSLSRMAVVCCLADSLNLTFLARGLDGVENGTWVEIYGRLEPTDASDKAAAKALGSSGKEVSLTVVNPAYRIVVEAFEPIPVPDPPFLFEFREAEPFAW